jgi:tRNA(Ile)-lysidine synthase
VLVVACSGGADSVGLLRAAHALLSDADFISRFSKPPQLLAWHFNHRLREENDQAESFVADLCAALELPVPELDRRGDEQAEVTGGNLEARLRRERYAALLLRLDELGERLQAVGPVIALTAHHLGDQAETILHHLLRGTQLGGLRGIHPVLKEHIHRPWLALAPEQIRAYLAQLGQAHIEDHTNQDLSLTRNRLRHKVIPELLALNAKAREHIARLAPAAALAQRAIRRRLARIEVEVFTAHDLQRWLPLIGWVAGHYELHRAAQPWGAPDLLALYAAQVISSRAAALSQRDYDRLQVWAAGG